MLILALVASLHATAPFTAPVATPQDPPAQVLKMFPLRNLHGFKTQLEIPPLGSQLGDLFGGGFDESHSASFDTSRPPSGLKTDQIVDLVGLCCSEAWENGDLVLDVHNGWLFATGTAADVDAVGRALASIEKPLTATIDVEIHLVPWTSDQSPPTRLDPAATDAFLAAHTPTWSGRSRIRTGDLRTLAHTTWSPYVHDCEVEAAERSTISDPLVRRFFEGLMVTLEVHTLSQPGVLSLLGQFAYGELDGPMATVSTGIKKMPPLDTPVLTTASGTFSGRFESDGALVLGFGGRAPGPQVAILLRASRSSAAGGGGPQFIPVSALTTRSLAIEPDEPDFMSGFVGFDGGGWGAPDSIAGGLTVHYSTEQEFALEPLSLDLIEELVRIRYPALDEDVGVTLRALEQGLFVFGDPQLGDQIRQFVGALEDRYLTSSELRFEVGGAGRPGWWVTAPALHDRRHCLFSGRDTTVVGDYEVEIAQRAGIGNPMVRNLFTGIAVNFAIHSGEPTLDLMGSVNIASAPTRRPSQSDETPYLQLPHEARTTVHCVRSFEAGSPIDLGNGPVRSWLPAGARERTTISVTVQ